MAIFLKPKTGISLVELVVVVALLSIFSLAAVQPLNMTEKTMIGSQTKLNQQLRRVFHLQGFCPRRAE